MGEKKKKKHFHIAGWWMALLFLTVGVTAGLSKQIAVTKSYASINYELGNDNDLSFTNTDSYSSSAYGKKYSVEGWRFFAKETGAGVGAGTYASDPVTKKKISWADLYNSYGLTLEFEEPVKDTAASTSDKTVWINTVKAESLLNTIFGDGPGQLNEAETLKKGGKVKLYANRIVWAYDYYEGDERLDKQEYGPLYTYPQFINVAKEKWGISWSERTQMNAQDWYDQEINFTLRIANITYKEVMLDGEQEITVGTTTGESQFFGRTVSKIASDIENYVCTGYYITVGTEKGDFVAVKEPVSVSLYLNSEYLARGLGFHDDSVATNNITITFVYEPEVTSEPTAPPSPTPTPVLQYTFTVRTHYVVKDGSVETEKEELTIVSGNTYPGKTFPETKIRNGDNYVYDRAEVSGDAAVTDRKAAPVAVTQNSTIDVYYKYDPPTYTVTVSANDEEATVSGGGQYKEGDTVTITTSTTSGMQFNGWDNNYNAGLNPTDKTVTTHTFTMPAHDVDWTANYGHVYDLNIIIHYTKNGTEAGKETKTEQYGEGSAYPGYDFGETRTYGDNSYTFSKAEYTGCITGTDQVADSASITGDSTIKLWYEYTENRSITITIVYVFDDAQKGSKTTTTYLPHGSEYPGYTWGAESTYDGQIYAFSASEVISGNIPLDGRVAGKATITGDCEIKLTYAASTPVIPTYTITIRKYLTPTGGSVITLTETKTFSEGETYAGETWEETLTYNEVNYAFVSSEFEGCVTGTGNVSNETVITSDSTITLNYAQVPDPTPTPAVFEVDYDTYDYYFTTDKGYTLESILSNGSYYLAGWNSSTYYGQFSEEYGVRYLTRDVSYPVGTDSAGNTWYFIPDGTNATWVHPAVYNGYDANTEAVKLITELTFPETITYNGTAYTVVSIGGGTATYRTPGDTVVERDEESGTSYTWEGYRNKTYGYHYHTYMYENTSTDYYRGDDIDVFYGVIGNGTIYSEGFMEEGDTESGGTDQQYWRNYYVYNTTLKEITIPDTVTTIYSRAFEYCEALTTIHGGEGITNIETRSFASSGIKTAQTSYESSVDETTYTESIYHRYYYNTDMSWTTKTAIMKEWEKAVAFPGEFVFPYLPKLKTLEKEAFAYHTNIDEVFLSETATAIYDNAFVGCTLDYIRIPSASTVIYGDTGYENSPSYSTLGSKGRVAADEKTILYTVPGSKAIDYGWKYRQYYKIMAGYPIVYHPNGGAPDTTFTYTSEMVNNRLSPAKWLGYGSFYIIDGKLYTVGSGLTSYGTYVEPEGEILYENYSNYLDGFISYQNLIYVYKKDDGTYWLWYNNSVSQIPVAEGYTYLGTGIYMPYDEWDSNVQAWIYCYDAEGNRVVTYEKYLDRSSATWYGPYKQFYDSEFVTVEKMSDNRFCLVDETYSTNYSYRWIFDADDCPEERETDDAGNDNYTYTYEYKSTSSGSSTTSYAREFNNYFEVRSDGRLRFSGRYTLNMTVDDIGYDYRTATYVAGAYKQYSYGKLYLALNEGKVIEIWVVDSTTPYLKSVTVLDTLDAEKKGTVYAAGENFIVDSNGYHYYVERNMEDIQNGTTNNYQYVPLLTSDGEHFCKETTTVYYGKTNYLQDAEGLLYKVTRDSESYEDADGNYYYVYTYTVTPLSFGGFDGEIVKKAILDYGSGSSASTKYKEYFLTDKGSLYCFGYNGAAYKLTGSGVYLAEMTGLFHEEEFSITYDSTTADSIKFIAMDTNGRMWSLSSQTSLKNISNGKTYVDYTVSPDEYNYFAVAYDADGNCYVWGTVAYVADGVTSKTLDVFTDPNTFVDFSQLAATKVYTYNGANYITDVGRLYSNWSTSHDPEYYWVESEFDLGYHFEAEIYDNGFFNKSSHEFTGWNTKADGTGTSYAAGDTVTITADLNLYAQWELEDGTGAIIHYNANGGDGHMADTELASEVTSFTVPECTFTRTGYKLKASCWNTKADGTGTSYKAGDTITGVTGEITLYAQWESNTISYTLIYMKYPAGTADNAEWKRKMLTISATSTATETIEGAPFTATGYTVTYNLNKSAGMSTTPTIGTLASTSTTSAAPTFSRWLLYEQNSSGDYVYFGTKYKPGDIKSWPNAENGDVLYLYPEWGGSGYVILPEATCTGYELVGWCEKSDGSTEIFYPAGEESEEAGIYTPLKNTTLYAVWSPEEKTITLNGQDATTQTQTKVTVTFDAKGPAVTVPTKERHVFQGYYTQADGAGTKMYDKDGNAVVAWSANTWTAGTLYAYWVPDRAIEYDANGGTGTMDTTWIETGASTVTLRANTFTKTGYHFGSWNTKADGTGTKYTDGQTISASSITTRVTLYVQWEPNIHTITLNKQSATTNGTTSVTATYDAAMPTPITLPKREYVVTFNANSGTCTTASLTSKYSFGGYYTKTGGEGTQYYTAAGASARTWNIDAATTLYAKWTSASVTLPTPTRTGYTFAGWYDAATGGNKIGDAGAAYTPTEAITLHARWTPNEYVVTFDFNFDYEREGIDPETNWTGDTKTVTYDSAYGALPEPARYGYEFDGWFMEESADGNGAGTEVNAEVIVRTASDHTLHARWKKKEITSAEINLFSMDPTYIIRGNLLSDPELPTLEWREFGDTMLEVSVSTIGYFDYAVVKAPWETQERTFTWEEGIYDEASDSWIKNENVVFWRSQLLYPEEEDNVRRYPGYKDQTYTITVSFYVDDIAVKEYKVGLYMVSWDTWKQDFYHPVSSGGSWDFNGDGIPDRWPFNNGTN